MTITRRNILALSVSAAMFGLAGCASPGLGSGPSISGVVAIGGPLANATVSLVDAKGVKKTATASCGKT